MIYDIATAQFLYGANRTDTSDSIYTLHSGSSQASSIWDAGGIDSITVDDAGGSGTGALIDLRGGINLATFAPYWSHYGNEYMDIAFDPENSTKVVNIENATGGSGNDQITGNDIANIISGGGGGTDLLKGGLGSDTYVLQTATPHSISIDDPDNQLFLTVNGTTFYVGTTTTVGGITTNTYYNADDLFSGLGLQYNSTDHSVEIYKLIFNPDTPTTRGALVATIQHASALAAIPSHSPSDPAVSSIEVDYTRYTTLTGDTGNNSITGGTTNDSISGGDGNDSLFGSLGDDTLYGGDGNDYLDGEAGNDSMVGGAGDDRYVVDSTSDVVVESSSAGTDTVYSSISYTLGSNVENLTLIGGGTLSATGNSLSNVIQGNSADNALIGGAGSDTLYGGYGFDTASYASAGGAVSVDLGTNTNTGSDAAGDMLYGIEKIIGTAYNDTLVGSDADETFVGGAGSDYIDGGNGIDTVSFETSSTWVSANLGTNNFWNGDAAWDNVLNVENLTGSAYADYLGGSSVANVITGGAGNDSIEGFGGNDTLIGGDGDDLLYGGDGDDLIIGGPGSDYIDGGNGIDTLSFESSANWISGNLGTNTYFNGEASWDNVLSNVENLIGSAYGDYLGGSSVANVLDGGAGNDSIEGFDGNDTIIGGSGDDLLYGGNNDDLIIGGPGSDYVDGGAGSDTLSFETSSTWVSADLANNSYWNGDAAWDNVTNVENLKGSAFDDYLYGNSSANILTGGDGADHLEGRGGNDTLYGGAGDDTFVYAAGSGVDTISGFEGAGATGGDVIQIASSIYSTAAIALTHVTYGGGEAVLDLGAGNSVHLVGVTGLIAGDFTIV